MQHLDQQLSKFSDQLNEEVGIGISEAKNIASTIAVEIKSIPLSRITEVIAATPVDIKCRLDELIGFQHMMDFIEENRIQDAGIIRSQVIAQNYICFVYLKDGYFRAPQKILPHKTICHRCCNYLTSGNIRHFRNAIAHGNWNYNPDFSGLVYWDYKDGRRENGFRRHEISQSKLNFWQSLSRGVAYASFITITNFTG